VQYIIVATDSMLQMQVFDAGRSAARAERLRAAMEKHYTKAGRSLDFLVLPINDMPHVVTLAAAQAAPND